MHVVNVAFLFAATNLILAASVGVAGHRPPRPGVASSSEKEDEDPYCPLPSDGADDDAEADDEDALRSMRRTLNVHVVPHTHDDVGWLKTVDQYYYGLNNTIQAAHVGSILDSVLLALSQNSKRTFTYVETKFFSMWYATLDPPSKSLLKQLVDSKRFSFANGGWCMHDEANTHYIGMIDQTALGHAFLKKELGVVPTVGWQIDPFGHTATQASLLTSGVGFDALYFGRIHHQDLERRRIDAECEGLWQSSTTAHHRKPPSEVTMVKTSKPAMDDPEDLRQKLRLLEGDRNAYKESSETRIEGNRRKIVALRRKNKELVSKLRELKNPANRRFGTGIGAKAVELLDHRVSNQIKRHNAIRSEAKRKEAVLVKLQKGMIDIDREQTYLDSHAGGQSHDSKVVNELQNEFDKAKIRGTEAKAIGATYNKIIKQLLSDRLEFDNETTDLEKMLGGRQQELIRLEALHNDAILSRDTTKKALYEAETKATDDRGKRDAEKKKLNAVAEVQRQRFDAMERRLRMAGAASTSNGGAGESERAKMRKKIESYEEAMRRIQDATGVSDFDEVVTRFHAQGESKAYLDEMRVKNTALLEQLREQKARVMREFEALKYSGEARNTSNQRMLKDFEAQLTVAERKEEDGEAMLTSTSNMLIRVKTGIDHLHDKLETLNPVTHRAANTVETKLEESELRLVELVKELEQRKSELTPDDQPAPLVVSDFNQRVQIAAAEDVDKQVETESEDEYVVSRDQIKKQAQDLVDSKTKKVKRKKKGGR